MHGLYDHWYTNKQPEIEINTDLTVSLWNFFSKLYHYTFPYIKPVASTDTQ